MTAIDEAPARDARTAAPTEVDILVLGAGFSGLGMGRRLKDAGHRDFVILERGEDVGGTWHFNTYPGCGCDVPSHLYSFSFAPNPDWTETYSRQPEIRAYLRRCADDFGLRPHLRTSTTVRSGAWDDATGRWEIETDRGAYRARVLISGAGALTEPKLPDVPGLDVFEGEMFHSARWNHGLDLRGRRVAVIGTGASAIQFVPAIQPLVAQLTVLKRTAPWVMPHPSRPITRLERRLYRRFPPLQKLARGFAYAAREWLVLGFTKEPRIMRVPERIARKHIEREIADPALRAKVTPGYVFGCKRILPSNRWYRALAQPNVELLTGGAREIRARSVVAGDGEEREVDTIIFGTGFEVVDMPVGHVLHGRDGRTLHEAWGGSPRAHLGLTMDGFPNLFLLLGPNTGLGHSSMVYMAESQIAQVMEALRAMQASAAEVIEVRPEAVTRYAAEMHARHQGTVWTTGCDSWYLDDTGRNPTLWPDWTWRFRRRTARFDAGAHVLRRAAQPAGGTTVRP